MLDLMAAGTRSAIVVVLALLLVLGAVALVLYWRKRRAGAARSTLGEQALEAVPYAIFVVHALRRGSPNVYVNAAYSALTGYDAGEAVTGGFDALSIFADAAELAAFDGRRQPATSARVTVQRRDGSTFPAKLELRSSARAGETGYVIGILESIEGGERASDRKPAPPPPAESARAKDAFLSWLNHELRSPLNACVMWLDVLALAPRPDKLTQAVDAIKRNLARQTRLVNDLNDAAKVASSTLEIRSVPVDLVAVFKRGLDGWQLLAIGKQIPLRHSVELDAAPLDGDPDRLLQALNHILENAIGSTPSGGQVSVTLRGADGHCVVEVEDTGVGLSSEDVANLGTPLWRAPTSAKARSGLGLGLAVAHYIAQRHGGSLTAASDTTGARFTLILPLAARGGEPHSVAQANRSAER